MLAFGHPQGDETLRASHLYLHFLTVHVGPPAGEVESVQAQDKILGCKDGKAIVEWPVLDDFDASAVR